MSIFRRWGVEPIINASGAVTRLGGAPMSDETLDAFRLAAADSVPLEFLQAAASRQLSHWTGAEAGLVTSGAAAGLTLGAAAILARFDLGRMERLPDCSGFPHEFVVPREQRNGYDHAVRAAGARLIEVGFQEIVAGAGVRRCEAWEIAAAIGPSTAGVLYVHDAQGRPPLREVVQVAHDRGLPVLVDAAGELPPRANLREILASGADLVAFSGGKAIRGPQATGLLVGRGELIASAALQMLDMDDHFDLWSPPADWIDKSLLPGMPRHGIGRAMKVSKEQIAALLVALERFASGVDVDELSRWRSHLEAITQGLADRPGVTTRIVARADDESPPILEIGVDSRHLGKTARDVCRSLRAGSPPIYVGHGRLDDGLLVIHPLHLTADRTRELLRRLREELSPP